MVGYINQEKNTTKIKALFAVHTHTQIYKYCIVICIYIHIHTYTPTHLKDPKSILQSSSTFQLYFKVY